MTDSTQSQTLASWNDGAARQAIVDFVDRVTDESSRDYVPPPERVAVFDNDGTLWCEKPMPIELGFILRRFVEMASRIRRFGIANRGRRHVSVTTHGWAARSPSITRATRVT